MHHDTYDATYLSQILRQTRSIALVGASRNPDRPSNRVMSYLQSRGYEVTPINPGLAGQALHGRTVLPDVSALPGPVDMIDVFRNNDALPGLMDEIMALPWKPKVIWMQLGVHDDAVAAKAEALGIKVVMNRCPAIEIPRLGI